MSTATHADKQSAAAAVNHLPHGYERFGTALLLATPSELNRAWLGCPDALTVDEAFSVLELSPEVEKATRDFMALNEGQRDHFKETASRLVSFYTGDPCPPRAIAKVLIQTLRNLDHSSSADHADRSYQPR